MLLIEQPLTQIKQSKYILANILIIIIVNTMLSVISWSLKHCSRAWRCEVVSGMLSLGGWREKVTVQNCGRALVKQQHCL